MVLTMAWSMLESTTSTLIEKRGEEMDEKYEKFLVLYKKEGHPSNAVPWTGIEQTISFIREKLEDGYSIQVKPFTRENWAID